MRYKFECESGIYVRTPNDDEKTEHFAVLGINASEDVPMLEMPLTDMGLDELQEALAMYQASTEGRLVIEDL